MKRIVLTLAALAALTIPAALAARSLTASARAAAPAAHSGVVCYTHCYPSGLCMTSCF
jgi:hypothetical protein